MAQVGREWPAPVAGLPAGSSARPGEEPGDGPTDAELITAVRAGDLQSYGLLFERHVEAARRLARQLVSASDADDLVSEAFAKVLRVLQRGGGPDLAFRAYLLTAVRRLQVDRIRSTARLQTTDDLTPYDPGIPFEDPAVAGFENAAAARAFASLPERWQLVLWHTEVEGQKPAEIAQMLGMSPNSVSALAYRAREGLREAFITMHAQDVADDGCAPTRGQLGAFIRGGISRRDGAKVEAHLRECRPCTGIYLELTEVNSDLRGLLAPLVLGPAALAYLTSAVGAAGLVAAKGGLAMMLVDRARDVVLANAATTAVAGVATTAVVTGGVVAGVQVVQRPGPIVAGTQVATAPERPGSSSTARDASGGPGAPSGLLGVIGGVLPSLAPTPSTVPSPSVLDPGPTISPSPTGPTSPATESTDPTDPTDPTSATDPADPSDPPGETDPTAEPQPTDTPSSTEPSPTDEPSPTMSGTASTEPSSEPSVTANPSGEPTDEPSTQPSDPPTDLPAVPDLSVDLVTRSTGGIVWDLAITVDGTKGRPATLVVVSDNPSLLVELDPACSPASAGRVVCTVGASPTTFHLTAVPPLLAATIVTATATYDDGSVDLHPGNDSAQATLD